MVCYYTKIQTSGSGFNLLSESDFSIFQGTPSSDQVDFEPRLDPQEWNKHFNQRKSLRFALKQSADRKDQQIKPETRANEGWDSLRNSNPDKPTLKQFLKKYSSTTIDPMDLIR